MGVGFVLAAVVGAIAFPSPDWTGDVNAFAASFKHPVAWSLGPTFSLLIIPGWIGLAVAVHAYAPEEKRIFTRLALVLTAAYTTTVGANDIIQITTVRLNLEAGTTDGLALWILDNPRSLFYPLEMLGYLWQSLAAPLVALAFAGPGIERGIRWSFWAVAVSGVWGLGMVLLGLDFLNPVFVAGSAIWVAAFPLGTVLCALVFRRLRWAGESARVG
jgi:hypothetical protein